MGTLRDRARTDLDARQVKRDRPRRLRAGVSRDAHSVDGRANEVRGAISNVSSNLSSLRAVLVKVVRTTTEEADRRRGPRFKSGLRIQVTWRGKLRPNVTLADISEGGAWIRGVPELDEPDNTGDGQH